MNSKLYVQREMEELQKRIQEEKMLAELDKLKERSVNKYRKKPVVIEAMRFTGENYWEVMQWMQPGIDFREVDKSSFRTDVMMISTLEGIMTASMGDWIIKGIRGEFYPCRADIFEATYEGVG